MFNKTEVIAFNSHKDLMVDPTATLKAFAPIIFCPIVLSEIDLIARKHPIVFDLKSNMPLAIIGANGKSFFVKDGVWVGDYQPMYMQKHPFILVKQKSDKKEKFNFFAAIDRSADCFKGGNSSLFDGDKLSAWSTAKIKIAEQMQKNVLPTQAAIKKIIEYSLLTKSNHGEFNIIDSNQLKKLSGEQILELYRVGGVQLIHAHIASGINLKYAPYKS